MKEIVKFPMDTPVEVALRFEHGMRVEGRYGDQIMYSLIDNRVMYVPPAVEQRIQELAVAPGEPLMLCKKEMKSGNRKWVEWNVRRAPQQPPTSANGTVAAAKPLSRAHDQKDGNTNGSVNGQGKGPEQKLRVELIRTTMPEASARARSDPPVLAKNDSGSL